MTGMLSRVALQAAYFIIVARSLGASDFGAFSAVIALSAILVPFSTLGAGNLFTKHIRRDSSLAGARWSLAVKITLLSGTGFVALLVLLGHWVAPSSVTWTVLLCIGCADLIFSRLVDIAGQANLALGHAARMAHMLLWLTSVRLVAAVVLTAGPWQPTLTTWAWLYLASSIPAAAAAVYVTTRTAGRARARLRDFASDFREGIYFALSISAQSVYNDIDKAMLGRLSTLQATGLYSAAYRIIDVAMAPMRGIFAAAYPRFFDHQEKGIRSALVFTRRLSRPTLGIAAASTVGLLVCADLVPIILGDDYAPAVGALRALAVLPILKAIQTLAADTLTGVGFQGPRAAVQVAIAVVNVAANLVLIPLYSWQGAVAASLGCDALLALALWVLVAHRLRREDRDLSRHR